MGLNMWAYNNKEINTLEDILEINPTVLGFVYEIILFEKGTSNILHKYIGKKNLYSTTKRKFGKKESALITDKRKKLYEYVSKESDWKTYMSSNKFIKANYKDFDVLRKIISFHSNLSELSFQEAKEIICTGALECKEYLNDGVSIKRFFKKD